MRAAGYKGPDVFSAAAVLHIGKASQGLMRRVNILADKALLAAFVENTHKIEDRHVQAAIRDSEMVPMRNILSRKSVSMVGGIILLAATLAGAGWFMGQSSANRSPAKTVPPQPVAASSAQPLPTETASAVAAASEVVAASAAADTSGGTILPLDQTLTLPAEPVVVAKRPPPPAARETATVKADLPVPEVSLLQQRLNATNAALSAPNRGNISIQLFYTDDVRPERMERFLGRAQRLGKFAEIYIVSIKLNGKDGYRILYGLYTNSDAARAGMNQLPQRYKDAFAPTLYMMDDSQ
jgi:septal ring-binding cell division protein DamX